MYIELPTYKAVVVDQCSKNLETQSCPLQAIPSHFHNLEGFLPDWRKLVSVFCHLIFSQDKITNFETSGANVARMIHLIAYWCYAVTP
jgi:hypothetical protein